MEAAAETSTMTQSVDNFFYSHFQILPDPRTKDWFLIPNFKFSFSVVGAYLLFCLVIGPLFMKSRKALQLTNILTGYNLTMVLVSTYVSYESYMGGWGTTYQFLCQPIGAPDDKTTLRMTSAHYVYFFSKYFELLDTIFFVLRKKDSQITFLHVYHHAVVVLMSHCSVRYLPDGHGTLIVLLNSLIHMVMYFYYFMAALGPKMQKYLWWKKYLTSLQLVQFIMTVAHASFVFHPSCSYPRPLVVVLMANVGLFLMLFANFYVKNYNSKNNQSKQAINGGAGKSNNTVKKMK